MKKVSITLLKIYQKVISPLLGNNCRFYPSCSSYAITSLERYGFLKGIFLTLQRLSKCHPLSNGGIDLVPERSQK